MTAKDYYRILSLVKGMEWSLVTNPKERFGVPSKTEFVQGYRHSFYYSPSSAVASAVRRKFIDVSDKNIKGILRLDRRTWRRIQDAAYQRPGYSKAVRRKLLAACRLH